MKKNELVKIINKELKVLINKSNTVEDLLFKLAGLYGIVLTDVREKIYPDVTKKK